MYISQQSREGSQYVYYRRKSPTACAYARVYWYDQYVLNEQETAFRAYDPERITDELVATSADIIAIYAVNQYGIAYYPSGILPQHPNLRGRDYVGDLTTRLRAQGKKIILLCQLAGLKTSRMEHGTPRPGGITRHQHGVSPGQLGRPHQAQRKGHSITRRPVAVALPQFA